MPVSADQVAQVRAFNRDYTRRIGVLSRRLLDSRYSLTEARVLYEIAHRPQVTAKALGEELGLDRGYLSRILKRFEADELLARHPAASDARRRHLSLTAAGRRAFVPLDRRSQAQVRRMLADLGEARRHEVVDAMGTIRAALAPAVPAAVHLRGHRPGDMGWVVERHGALYSSEFGWNEEFEGLVAGIVAEFIRNLDPARERCWIAERDGRRLGCIFLVAGGKHTAKLRLLLLEPEARGLGLGRRLVRECVEFARAAGYRRITLWTQRSLGAARQLYREAGFRRTAAQKHTSFGRAHIGETWELGLADAARRQRRGRRA